MQRRFVPLQEYSYHKNIAKTTQSSHFVFSPDEISSKSVFAPLNVIVSFKSLSNIISIWSSKKNGRKVLSFSLNAEIVLFIKYFLNPFSPFEKTSSRIEYSAKSFERDLISVSIKLIVVTLSLIAEIVFETILNQKLFSL